MNIKRLLSILLTLTMLVGLLSVTALAADTGLPEESEGNAVELPPELVPIIVDTRPQEVHSFMERDELMTNAAVAYIQMDEAWGDYPYGYSDYYGGTPATLASSGCGLLAMTNAVHYLNGEFIEPTFLADYSLRNGYRINGCGTDESFFPGFCRDYGSVYGVSYGGTTSGSFDTLRQQLEKGGAAVAAITTRASGYGHWLTIADYDQGYYLVLDSYPSSQRGTKEGAVWMTRNQLEGYMYISQLILLDAAPKQESSRPVDETPAPIEEEVYEMELPAPAEPDADLSYYEAIMAYGDPSAVSDASGVITRGTLASVLWRMEGQPATGAGGSYASDVSDSQLMPAAWAVQMGLMSNGSDGSFRPDDALSQQEFVSVLYRYAAAKGYDTTVPPDLTAEPLYGEISEGCTAPVLWAVNMGLITELYPQWNVDRAVAAWSLQQFVSMFM